MTTFKNMLNAAKTARDEFSFDVFDAREVAENIRDNESDFEVNGVRFIADSEIDKIMQDELSNDEYILGCFNAWFLARVLDIDSDVIEAMQASEAKAAIGKLVLSLGKLPELQADYASADGYGHHFNHVNGGEVELSGYRAFEGY